MSNEKTYRRRFEEQVIASSRLSDKCIELQAENKQLKKQVGDLRAAAVRKGLMKGGSFTGKP